MNIIQRRKIKRATNLRLLFFTFIGAFILFFTAFTIFLPVLTPKVEIPALTEEHVIESITSHDFRRRIDPRLHSIELQEQLTPIKSKATNAPLPPAIATESVNSGSNENEWLYDPNKTKINTQTPQQTSNDLSQEEYDTSSKSNNAQITLNIPPRPKPVAIKEKINIIPPVPIFQAKVIVGDFSNPKEAKMASDILISLNFEPFLRERNGQYILQIASFADLKKAEGLVTELKNRNFDAKIIYE